MKQYPVAIDVACLQRGHVYPARNWETIFETTLKSVRGNKNVCLTGGWAIHLFLKSVDPELAIYKDMCDIRDFDLVSSEPAACLVRIADAVAAAAPKVYPGPRFVECGYASPAVFKFLPKIKLSGYVVIDPRVELLMQYNRLASTLHMPSSKDLQKVMKRIALLEEHALMPWLRRHDAFDDADRNKKAVELKRLIWTEWLSKKDLVVPVAAASRALRLDTPPERVRHLELVVHDILFEGCVASLVRFLKKRGTKGITVNLHGAFMESFGPTYNGWLDVLLYGTSLMKLYSYAYPVHMYTHRICSYFLTASHVMWRVMHAGFTKNVRDEKYYKALMAALHREFETTSDKYFSYTDGSFAGVLPIRIQNKQGTTFRYRPGRSEESMVPSVVDSADGRIVFSSPLPGVNEIPSLRPVLQG